MRLIDADALCIPSEEINAKMAIACAPVIDAEPVVRCKDCRWWKTNCTWNGKEVRVCVIEPYEPCRKPDDYCSRGEPKGGEE